MGAGTALLDGASREDGRPPINLIICDSQPIFAQGLLQLLASEAPEFEVSGITRSVEDLLEMTRRLRPDLVLLDARFGIEPAQPLFLVSPLVNVILVARFQASRSALVYPPVCLCLGGVHHWIGSA